MLRARSAHIIVVAGILSACTAPSHADVIEIAPSPRVQHELQSALIRALPGDVIELEAGVYRFDMDLLLTTDNLTIRGAGEKETRLSFRGQTIGSKGIEVTGDNFVIEKLAIEDTRGNGIKLVGSRGVIVRHVRIEWTDGPSEKNGAYGIYPVQSENVLIEDCVSIGASDAGIYVGQSTDVVVRRCHAERNVVGIEIENCRRADVYDCIATNNAGGVLVVDLPGLQLTNGRQVRVFRNRVFENNHANFASPGNVVATVPPGTGVMVIATDRVEIFKNRIRDNKTAQLSVLSYLITERRFDDPDYDPFSESISVHDNVFLGGGDAPAGRIGELLGPFLREFPDIFYDGIVNPKHVVDGKLPKTLGLHLERNGSATFANVHFDRITPALLASGDLEIDSDASVHSFPLDPLPAVELRPLGPPERLADATLVAFRDAPKTLSGYGLFADSGATQEPVPGVMPYDLNTELFADYKTKRRFIRVPNGTRITYRESGVFKFPVGTIIAKTFSAPRDMTDPSSGERLLETRIIKRLESGWVGLPYIWRDDQSDAELELGGGAVDVTWIHEDGTTRSSNYLIPHANQCKSCHVVGETFVPIGPKARNLNKDFPYKAGAGSANQLARWAHAGILRDAPADPASAPRAPRYDDPKSGSLVDRARIWLDINCAHCHNPFGAARTSGLDLRYEQKNRAALGVWKSPVAAGRGSGGRQYSIVPGKPDESILVYRIDSTEPGVMMPELPRRLVPKEGLAVIREWIAAMK